jgi:hypothetical protein
LRENHGIKTVCSQTISSPAKTAHNKLLNSGFFNISYIYVLVQGYGCSREEPQHYKAMNVTQVFRDSNEVISAKQSASKLVKANHIRVEHIDLQVSSLKRNQSIFSFHALPKFFT